MVKRSQAVLHGGMPLPRDGKGLQIHAIRSIGLMLKKVDLLNNGITFQEGRATSTPSSCVSLTRRHEIAKAAQRDEPSFEVISRCSYSETVWLSLQTKEDQVILQNPFKISAIPTSVDTNPQMALQQAT